MSEQEREPMLRVDEDLIERSGNHEAEKFISVQFTSARCERTESGHCKNNLFNLFLLLFLADKSTDQLSVLCS